MPNKRKKNDLAPLKVWIIFQGDDASEPRDKLILGVYKNLAEGGMAVPHTTGAFPPDAKMTIHERVQKSLDICDAAIAIITEDDRGVYEAGNLLYEIGLWCGRKDPENLLICRDKSVDVSKISDLAGVTIPAFSSEEELMRLATTHVAKVRDKLRPSPPNVVSDNYLPNKKIATYLSLPNGDKAVDRVKREKSIKAICLCQNDPASKDGCKVRRNTLLFASETARYNAAMDRSQRVLRALTDLCRQVLDIRDVLAQHFRDPTDGKPLKSLQAMGLQYYFDELFNVVSADRELAKQNHYKREGEAKGFEQKLFGFLRICLGTAHKQRIKRFVDGFTKARNILRANPKTRKAQDPTRLCKALKQVLDEIGIITEDLLVSLSARPQMTRVHLEKRLLKAKGVGNFGTFLADINEDWPHIKKDDMRIWRTGGAYA